MCVNRISLKKDIHNKDVTLCYGYSSKRQLEID